MDSNKVIIQAYTNSRIRRPTRHLDHYEEECEYLALSDRQMNKMDGYRYAQQVAEGVLIGIEWVGLAIILLFGMIYISTTL